MEGMASLAYVPICGAGLKALKLSLGPVPVFDFPSASSIHANFFEDLEIYNQISLLDSTSGRILTILQLSEPKAQAISPSCVPMITNPSPPAFNLDVTFQCLKSRM